MKRLHPLVIAVFVFAWALPARADLDAEVRKVLADRFLERAQVGIEMVELSDAGRCRVIYQLNSHTPLKPASNMKVVTTSTALDRLGPDFKFRTLLVQRGQDLILVGDGDPTFGDWELLKKVGWDVLTVYRHWADQLKARNITTVRNVLVDDTVFDQDFVHPTWAADQFDKRYQPEVAGMNLNANCLGLLLKPVGIGRTVDYATVPATRYMTVENRCVGDRANNCRLGRKPGTNIVSLGGGYPVANETPLWITVHDPSLYAATVLAETLAASGISVTGEIARDGETRVALAKPNAPGLTVLAAHETTMEPVLARANKDSMNLYAECLCKRVGFAATGRSGSWESGTAAAGEMLKRLGVPENEYHLVDGCGLSHDNAISPDAMVQVLVHNHRAAYAQLFRTSLAVPGEDGTLERRFDGSELRGRVHAKTGFIDRVSCLSGYLQGRNQKWYAFSILMNNIPAESNWKIKTLQETIVKAMDGETGR